MKKQFFRYLILGTLIMGTTISYSMPVSAKISPVFSKTLSLGGVELITLRGESAEAVKSRSTVLEDRLVMILSDSRLIASDVQVRKIKSSFVIYVKDRILVTVTAQDSAYNQSSPEKQAYVWQQQLAKTLPLVKVLPYRS